MVEIVDNKMVDRGGLPCKLSNYNIKRVIADEDYLQPTYTELFWQIQVSLLSLIKATLIIFLSLMLYSSEKN